MTITRDQWICRYKIICLLMKFFSLQIRLNNIRDSEEMRFVGYLGNSWKLLSRGFHGTQQKTRLRRNAQSLFVAYRYWSTTSCQLANGRPISSSQTMLMYDFLQQSFSHVSLLQAQFCSWLPRRNKRKSFHKFEASGLL